MPINVYYLDDEKSLCNIFSEIFSSDQIKITTFSESGEAIESCKTNPPDLMFIDYRLPGATGDMVADNIDKSIPKILVTGELAFKSDYKFQHVITKPWNIPEVRELLNSYL